MAVAGAFYLAPRTPAKADTPSLIEVDCLQVERGPVLRFEGGLLESSGAKVGTYRFLPAVAGRHRPRIEVQGVTVRRVGDRVVIEAGKHAWFWPFQNDNTVEIFFYPQDRTLAHRCTG